MMSFRPTRGFHCLQDVVAGDGTTSVTVICGALLKKCLDLLERGVHPTVISDAFNQAADKAVEVWCLTVWGAAPCTSCHACKLCM